MNPDTSYLSAEEREVVNLLIQAADLMSEIYLRQRFARNPEIRQAIAALDAPNRAANASGSWPVRSHHCWFTNVNAPSAPVTGAAPVGSVPAG